MSLCVCVCRGKLVKIMKRTREYTTPTTSLCFIAHLVVIVVVAALYIVYLLLLVFHLQFVVAAAVATVFDGCRTLLSLFLCHRSLFDIYNGTGQSRPPSCLPTLPFGSPLCRPTFRNVRELVRAPPCTPRSVLVAGN